jgi:ubiquitin carboxyl-terminal hydrolase 48
MQGVLRWKNDEGKYTQMNLVISSLQSLLAQMVHGAKSIVSTVEFSSALGLENDEMQDPNEFARLLFDRMHESFQQSSPFLKTLLPSLFQGVFEYKTICTKCQYVSTRKENFMDLNLPMMGDDAPLSVKDFTIEQLLESYLQIEILDGDNKYHCCRCDERTSAERRVTFSKLPPVLNIQLARYVFDLKTFRKKKLMDRILLPRELKIGKGTGENHTYILCAVQNHKGSSAYSGHYVAEVMDWTTGVWFEFDDEKVSKLDKGPLSSYHPSINTFQRPKEGTSDAYNLFYVELKFLRKTAEQNSMDMLVDTTSIVQQVSDELERSFNLEKE